MISKYFKIWPVNNIKLTGYFLRGAHMGTDYRG